MQRESIGIFIDRRFVRDGTRIATHSMSREADSTATGSEAATNVGSFVGVVVQDHAFENHVADAWQVRMPELPARVPGGVGPCRGAVPAAAAAATVVGLVCETL